MIILFEDDRVAQLFPATIGRAAYRVTCGSYQLAGLLKPLGSLQFIVRPHLTELERSGGNEVALTAMAGSEPTLVVNARVVPSRAVREELRGLLKNGQPGIVEHHGTLVLALLPAKTALPVGLATYAELRAKIDALSLPALDVELPLFDYPHDIVRHHLTTLGDNLNDRLAAGGYEETQDGVFVARGAKLGQYVVADTTKGPILLDEQASVGPYCYLSGPAYLGANARVIEHSALKDGVSLGHTTKIGGEVEGSVIEPYTNKQHHGFLGHSYLGSWVNLGAGTCNSDLKNTYGQVNMEYRGQKVPTGMQFIGAIVGDYSKTAINTGIFTGKTIGACSMVYGFVTTNVPSFVNYARSFGQVTEAPVEVMVATQARMFARRQVEQRPCDIQLLYDMHELTRPERQIAGEPLSL